MDYAPGPGFEWQFRPEQGEAAGTYYGELHGRQPFRNL